MDIAPGVRGRVQNLLEAEGEAEREESRKKIRDYRRQYEASDRFYEVLDEIDARDSGMGDLLGTADDAVDDLLVAVTEAAYRDALAGLGWLEASSHWPKPDAGDAFTMGALAAESGLAAKLYVQLPDKTEHPVDHVECHEGRVVIAYNGDDRLEELKAQVTEIDRQLAEIRGAADRLDQMVTVTERVCASHPADCDCDGCRWVRNRRAS